ncbi:hypothetical protein [Skermania piniformis]|uniref:Uncharacterized protein n=1 Tax=Skermania pinensis TaxID=39122 RepID=A0ABX8SB57_9ACTN|nr:hypothetical protein [Skermania piniformis]QXQ15028.1 hypothetical protein KV203_06645 [Skermania piniformis]
MTSAAYPLWTLGYGWAGQTVTATDFHTDAILRMLGDDFDPGGGEVTRTVELVPEPDNELDPCTVSVRFEGEPVGCLPRADAPRYQPPLLGLIGLGYLPTVAARIWSTESNEWDELGNPIRRVRTQIRLGVGDPHTMVPLNDPPADEHTLIPPGDTVQVLRTADHFEVLRRYPATNGTASLLVSLHSVEIGSSRSGRRVVEVRLDSTRIGQLSPSMSEKYLPAIDHLDRRGLTTCARAVLTASPVSAKVTLRARKAFELTEAELNGSPESVPARGIAVPTTVADVVVPADTVQSGTTTNGSTITVREQHDRSLVAVVFDFAEPLTAWQRRVATKVVKHADTLLAGARLDAPAADVTEQQLSAHAPLEVAQEFVDALIGIEDSVFEPAEEFCTQV